MLVCVPNARWHSRSVAHLPIKNFLVLKSHNQSELEITDAIDVIQRRTRKIKIKTILKFAAIFLLVLISEFFKMKQISWILVHPQNTDNINKNVKPYNRMEKSGSESADPACVFSRSLGWSLLARIPNARYHSRALAHLTLGRGRNQVPPMRETVHMYTL